LVLMFGAVPVGVITNAASVTMTGILTYHYGKQAAGGTTHDASGWIVYLLALLLLIFVDLVLMRILGDSARTTGRLSAVAGKYAAPHVLSLIVLLAAGGLGVAWLDNRGEVEVPRKPLSQLSANLGDWQTKGSDSRFDRRVEDVLGTTDYVMREYSSPEGRVANVYVGYYASQKMGATYHSPQNCLPGAGWVMSDPQLIEISTRDGRSFFANRYIVENGAFHQLMIYWYQGRGRTQASEYFDKLLTIRDSVLRRRSDGALVRVMTNADDVPAATQAAADLSARLAEDLNPFIPE
jgi:EpsI family protein